MRESDFSTSKPVTSVPKLYCKVLLLSIRSQTSMIEQNFYQKNSKILNDFFKIIQSMNHLNYQELSFIQLIIYLSPQIFFLHVVILKQHFQHLSNSNLPQFQLRSSTQSLFVLFCSYLNFFKPMSVRKSKTLAAIGLCLVKASPYNQNGIAHCCVIPARTRGGSSHGSARLGSARATVFPGSDLARRNLARLGKPMAKQQVKNEKSI